MSGKRIIGFLILIAGLALIFLSIYTNQEVGKEVAKAKAKVETMTNNPVTQMGGESVQQGAQMVQNSANQTIDNKAESYSGMIMWELYGGILLVIIGGATVIFCRHCKK